MENDQNSIPQNVVTPQSSGVSFPTVGAPKKSGGPKTLLIIGILILVAILGFVIYKSATKKSEIAVEPTPFDNLTTPDNQTAAVTTPTPTVAAASIDKTKIKIQVQNGTGITGEAAYLQTQLGNIGYTNVKVGNAGSQSGSATQVTFSSSLDSSVVAEITQKLKSVYQSVTVSNAGSTTFDVVIVTGLRVGSTPKPTATPSASASPSASPSSTP